MKSTRLKFSNSSGHLLSARMELPVDGKPHAFAIFAHCFTCSKNLLAVTNISRALSMEGFGVLRFDFTGLGDSEGEFAETNFSSNIQDLIDAATFLEVEHKAPALLIGHSLGGAAVLMAASRLPYVKAVVTIGAPADPPHVLHLFENNLEEIKEKGEALVSIGGRAFTIKKQFIEDLEASPAETVVKNLKRPLLVMHAPFDTTVGINNAAKIYNYAIHPKSFISLDKADHLLSKKEDSLYVGDVIACWVQKYIPVPEPEALETDHQVVVRTGEKGYTTEVKAGKHAFLADEPASVGGADLGPSPYELLSASLGTCTSMTLRMYADRKGWPLKNIIVHLSHSKQYAKDMAEADGKGARIDVINRVLQLEGDLDETQLARLKEIADRCPVHRTLHGKIEVRTELKQMEELA